MDSAVALREFLEFVIAQLVDHPEQASISHHMASNRHVFEVAVADTDVGRIIGKNGQTIGAMRNLLEAAASRNKEQVSLSVGPRPRDGEQESDRQNPG